MSKQTLLYMVGSWLELKQLFNAMDPAPFRADQKFSVCALVALVVGSMVGAGIYALPSAFGRATGAL